MKAGLVSVAAALSTLQLGEKPQLHSPDVDRGTPREDYGERMPSTTSHDQLEKRVAMKLKDSFTPDEERANDLLQLARAAIREGVALQNVPGYIAGAAILSKGSPEMQMVSDAQQALLKQFNINMDPQFYRTFLKELGYVRSMLNSPNDKAVLEAFNSYVLKMNTQEFNEVRLATEARNQKESGAMCSYEALLTQTGSNSFERGRKLGYEPINGAAASVAGINRKLSY